MAYNSEFCLFDVIVAFCVPVYWKCVFIHQSKNDIVVAHVVEISDWLTDLT